MSEDSALLFYPAAPRQNPDMEILGLGIHRAGVSEITHWMDRVLNERQKGMMLNLNVHCVNLAMKHRWLF